MGLLGGRCTSESILHSHPLGGGARSSRNWVRHIFNVMTEFPKRHAIKSSHKVGLTSYRLSPGSHQPPMAEPPKLYGPHAHVIIPKTSNGYACVPYNLKSLSGVLEKPKSSTFYNSHRINKGVTTTLQHLLQNFTSECGRI
jgi:hypothetical protein